jgi:8-oxo-dGTP diphosphatase
MVGHYSLEVGILGSIPSPATNMINEKYKVRVAVYLILLRNNKILLYRRSNTGWMDGKYSLIAGHVNEGETVYEAIVRKAQGEGGISVSEDNLIPATVVFRQSNTEYVDFFFVAKSWQGEPLIGEPGGCDDMKWFSLDNLPSNLLPYIKEALENYKNKVPFFESGWN